MPTGPRCVAQAALATIIAIPAVLAQMGPTPVAQQFEKLHFRSIGPAIMSGRIADVAVYERNTSIWYAGSAHGGIWKANCMEMVLIAFDAGTVDLHLNDVGIDSVDCRA